MTTPTPTQPDLPVPPPVTTHVTTHVTTPLLDPDQSIAQPPQPKRTKPLFTKTLFTRTRAIIALSLFIPALALTLWFLLRPTPQPDYLNDNIDKLFGYTLLTDDFNNLPIDQRIELVKQLGQRLGSMSSSDSILLASFAAGIAGKAREQIEKNISTLMIDVFDVYAQDYPSIPPENRLAYIDTKVVEMVRLMEGLDGSPINKTDEEILDQAREQAARDVQWIKDPENKPTPRQNGRIFQFMYSTIGSHASPQQRARQGMLMRDMTRRLRGQNITTGKPPG